jgi:phosphoglycolate phosphatase
LIKPPKLILFDLDGTLIDSVPDLSAAVDATLRNLGLPEAGESRVRTWVGNGAAMLIARVLAHAGVEDELQSTALDHFLEYYERHCAQETCLYPNVEETLSVLQRRSVAMGIVTNKPRRFVAPILEHLKIAAYFQYIIGGDDLPEKKPHPLPLIHCMQALDYSADDTLMVGDSVNDIQAAQAAGVPIIAVSYGYNHGRPVTADGPDRVIANFSQLMDTFYPNKA